MNLANRSLANLLKGLVLVGVLANAPTALAEPPDWAPANGYRDHQEHEGNHGDSEGEHHGNDHHDHGYRGYDDREWHSDYGIVSGHCDRAAVGTVVGGVIGGVIGSSVGSPQNRDVAIVVGAIVGSVIGHEIGRDMDRADRGCIGHALELAHDGQSVQWRNAQRGIDYRVTPVGPWASGGSECRKFKVRVQKGGRTETQTGHACRSGDGEWRMT